MFYVFCKYLLNLLVLKLAGLGWGLLAWAGAGLVWGWVWLAWGWLAWLGLGLAGLLIHRISTQKPEKAEQSEQK